MDELVWAALWLYKATGRTKYMKFAENNYPAVIANSTVGNGLDYADKTLGIQVSGLMLIHRCKKANFSFIKQNVNE